jgi:hypothetical protein
VPSTGTLTLTQGWHTFLAADFTRTATKATNHSVHFVAGDPTIASIDKYGRLIALAPGQTTVKVTVAGPSKSKKSYGFTVVVEAPATA